MNKRRELADAVWRVRRGDHVIDDDDECEIHARIVEGRTESREVLIGVEVGVDRGQ